MRTTALSLLLALAPAAALADACETVRAAYERLAAAPAVHQTIRVADWPPMQMVVLADAMYVDQGSGAWMEVPVQPGMRAAMLQEVVPDAATLKDCRETGSEEVAGVATTIYQYLPPSFAGETPSPQTLWVGDGDGLPYRMTMESERQAMEMTLVYDGVTAPVP